MIKTIRAKINPINPKARSCRFSDRRKKSKNQTIKIPNKKAKEIPKAGKNREGEGWTTPAPKEKSPKAMVKKKAINIG